MEKLSIEKQIKALEIGLNIVKTCRDPFVCVDVARGASKVNGEYVVSNEISEYIPLLTIENAEKVCKRYKLKLPVKRSSCGGWWESGLRKPRVAFINWMIKELKSQL